LGRHIRWQAIITATGIALTLTFLGLLAFSRTTITLPDEQGTYREGIAGGPQLVNPLLAQYNPVDQDLSSLIFNGLTRSDGGTRRPSPQAPLAHVASPAFHGYTARTRSPRN